MSANLTADRDQTTQTYDETIDLSQPAPKPAPQPRVRREPLTADQQVLASKYLPMALSLTNLHKKKWPFASDDFDSAAQMALVEAAESFDPSHKVQFSTFAHYRILGAIKDVQRGLILAGWERDLELAPKLSGMSRDTENNGKILNTQPDPPVGQEFEAVEFVEDWLRKLPAKNAEACRQIYIHDRSQGQAAAKLGCSKSRISYLHKEAIELLKDSYADEIRDSSYR